MNPIITTYDSEGNYTEREMTDDEYSVYLSMVGDLLETTETGEQNV